MAGEAHEKNCAAVLMGPPGSGKTTVARVLAADNRITVIETGNLLDAEVKRGTPLGREIRPYKAAGDLVPAELVKRVISAQLERRHGKFVLFDGFPRSIRQVDLLSELLKERNLTLCAVINLNIEKEAVLKRLSGRRLCQNCGALYNIYLNPPRQKGQCDCCDGQLVQRPDDKEEIVRRRFENYERETVPVIDLFRKERKEICLEISAQARPDEVVNQVREKLMTATGGE